MASSLDIINVKKIYPDATLPTRGSKMAAGYDLYAYIEEGNVLIPPHSTILVGTGVAIQPPLGCFGAVFARSGLATKQGLRPANCVGVCDEDYTGQYMVALHNDTNEGKIVNHGERIAQVVFIPYTVTEYLNVVPELNETERGDGGFGSTGV